MSPEEPAAPGERHRDPTLNNPKLVCLLGFTFIHVQSGLSAQVILGKHSIPKRGKAVLAWNPPEGRLPITADSYPRQQWVHLWLCKSFW